MRKFSACWLMLSVLSQFGCVVTPEEGRTVSLPEPNATAVPQEKPLEIQSPRHDDASNAPRIILGRAYECLATYAVFNPNDGAAYVSKLAVSVRPAAAFETVAAEWTDDAKSLRAAMPNEDGTVQLSYPNVGARIAPHSSRYLRLCGVMKKVGTGIDSGTIVTASLVSVETLDGERARFTEEIAPPRHVLRASLPRITIMAPKREIHTGTLNLFEWTVEAHWFGPIAAKQFAFNLDFAGMKLCDFRLRDDSDEGPPDFDIVELTEERMSSRNLRDACLDHPAEIAVVFRGEYRFADGSGPYFTLSANVTTVGEKPSLHTGFLRSNDPITDTLACDTRGFALFSSDPTMVPGIIWSDLSANPHSSVCGKSRDWTTDALTF